MLPLLILLLTKPELGDKIPVRIDVDFFKIIEQALSATYHFKKTATRVIVVGVYLKMRVEVVDSFSKQSYLNFNRTGVVFTFFVLIDYCLFIHFIILLV